VNLRSLQPAKLLTYRLHKKSRASLTAENISDGYFAKIEPFFEPVSPKFILMVKVLNEGIISGSSSVADFDEYVALLVSALTAVLASQDSQSSRETLPRGTEFLDAETGAKNRPERPQVSSETESAE